MCCIFSESTHRVTDTLVGMITLNIFLSLLSLGLNLKKIYPYGSKCFPFAVELFFFSEGFMLSKKQDFSNVKMAENMPGVPMCLNLYLCVCVCLGGEKSNSDLFHTSVIFFPITSLLQFISSSNSSCSDHNWRKWER